MIPGASEAAVRAPVVDGAVSEEEIQRRLSPSRVETHIAKHGGREEHAGCACAAVGDGELPLDGAAGDQGGRRADVQLDGTPATRRHRCDGERARIALLCGRDSIGACRRRRGNEDDRRTDDRRSQRTLHHGRSFTETLATYRGWVACR